MTETPNADENLASEELGDEALDAVAAAAQEAFAARLAGSRPIPETVDESIVDEREKAEIEDTIYHLRSAAQKLEESLLGGKRVLTRKEVAQLAGVSTVAARKFWRALGMARVPEGQTAFTVEDAKALREIASVVDTGVLDEATVLSLARAIGQTSDRLVVWQMETLVEYLSDTRGLEETEARQQAIELFESSIKPLERVLVYAWRRNLAGALGRMNVNVAEGLAIENRQGWYDSQMPLARSVGFVDLVSYTRLSQRLEPKQLAFLVKRFQDIVFNVVATGNGRVIKTVGDEVFFVAETPQAGAEIALTIRDLIISDQELPQARLGLAWGRVLSRLGDVFGSTVNLAARLTAIGEPGTVATDWETARILERSGEYVFSNRQTITLQGLGEISMFQMDRGTAESLDLSMDGDE
ncbi:adenylate/guanylate cyclase domain-containing protein [Brevibacterium gallinarum]|uniref:Adenylate/guanylate cyclase domain-containing protein n=1 Tax=Brevibacterium gallinarum TaxID=2762220 RepID=A0ABR8WXW8_9MICO|nr:adenylate/guanylate cyclase domain-containing protein [Brevibacterium gallinarum]MBD8021787.1 adenylate/guanylate cyclase domain-containing protein [Brevibacterium gallinarum]